MSAFTTIMGILMLIYAGVTLIGGMAGTIPETTKLMGIIFFPAGIICIGIGGIISSIGKLKEDKK